LSELQKRVVRKVDEKEEEIIRFTQQLIRTPSVNHPPTGDEKACQDLIVEKFRQLGLKVDVFRPDEVAGIRDHPGFMAGRDYRDRPVVVGAFQGSGAGRSLILTGHIDVVPLEPHPWTVNPWAAELRSGKIFGRGALDMKGGMAAQIMALECVLEAGVFPRGDVILESVVDEEFGGVNGTLSTLLRGYTADAAICAEPTGLTISPGCLGGLNLRITTHAKRQKGIPIGKAKAVESENAIISGAAMVEAVVAYEEERQRTTPRHPLWRNPKYAIPSPMMISYLKSGEPGGMIIIPGDCVLEMWFTSLPGQYTSRKVWEKELSDYIRRRARKDPRLRNAAIKVGSFARWHPGYAGDPKGGLVKVVRKNVEAAVGQPVKVVGFPAPCDIWTLGIYGKMPSLLFGPEGGNPHSGDEWVRVDSLLSTTKALALSIVDWCGVD